MNVSNINFNGRNSKDLDLYVAEVPSIPLLNEDIDIIDVEGRNGSMIIKKGTYRDRNLKFTFRLLNTNNFYLRVDEILEWLSTITDNRLIYDRLDRCFRVKNIVFGDLERELAIYGKFEVNFLVEPFMEDLQATKTILVSRELLLVDIEDKYLIDSNASYLTTTGSINTVVCHGTMGAETLFKVYGSGNIQLTVNSNTMTVKNVSNFIEIDSKLMQVRSSDGTSKDGDALGNFSKLNKGTNTISCSGTITKIELTYTNQYR